MIAEHRPQAPPPGPRRSRRPLLVPLERLLLTVAIGAFGYVAGTLTSAAIYQHYESGQLDAILRSGPGRTPALGTGAVLGRIEIPRLGVSTIIKDGEDVATLQLAVGHISGTALPGEAGNIGLAGHRDTFFRGLRQVIAGDAIRLVTPKATYTYVVERTQIVQPDDVWVLDRTQRPSLTLVTCYPFTYLGAAPERFIVRARLDTPPPAPRSRSIKGTAGAQTSLLGDQRIAVSAAARLRRASANPGSSSRAARK
jgi:sortase A